jgi:hypothetical protein
MIRKTGSQNQKADQILIDWDGIERRLQERRNAELLELDQHQNNEKQSFISRYGSILATVISILATVITFGASLYNRVSNLEVKQNTAVEKIEEVKRDMTDIKNVLKEQDKSQKSLDGHISSIEETMMQLYRKK